MFLKTGLFQRVSTLVKPLYPYVLQLYSGGTRFKYWLGYWLSRLMFHDAPQLLQALTGIAPWNRTQLPHSSSYGKPWSSVLYLWYQLELWWPTGYSVCDLCSFPYSLETTFGIGTCTLKQMKRPFSKLLLSPHFIYISFWCFVNYTGEWAFLNNTEELFSVFQ
jgi:hypothetical protein